MKAHPHRTPGLRFTACAALVTAATLCGSTAEARAVEQIQRYCVASWRNAGIAQQDWNDCTQQAIERLLERVERPRFPHAIHLHEAPERRELNRAIWRTIQRWRRAKRHQSLDDLDVAGGEQENASLDEQDQERLADVNRAIETLTPTQRSVLQRWSEGEPVRQIAAALDISAARVSDHKYKAIRKLRNVLCDSQTC